jgi:HK97 family phage major capsid protein
LTQQLAEAREQRGPARAARDQARDAWMKAGMPHDESTASWKRAQKAVNELGALEERIEQLDRQKIQLLETLGENPGVTRPGRDGPVTEGGGADGWSSLAHKLCARDGRDRIEMQGRDLLRQPMAATTVTPSEAWTAPAVFTGLTPLPMDQRFIYPVFGQIPLDGGSTAISDYKATSRAIAEGGSVIRDPGSTEEKAQLNLAVELETPTVKQFAVIGDAPNQLFESVDAFNAYLQNEMRYALDVALDEHVLAQIAAAEGIGKGKTGTDLIARIRNGVSAMKAAGANPTVLALSPADAASLDLTKNEIGTYLFVPRVTGSASPIWGLQCVESPRVTNPILIDPAILGVLYSEIAQILIDVFTKMSTNETRIRIEHTGLFHVRSAAGAYKVE